MFAFATVAFASARESTKGRVLSSVSMEMVFEASISRKHARLESSGSGLLLSRFAGDCVHKHTRTRLFALSPIALSSLLLRSIDSL